MSLAPSSLGTFGKLPPEVRFMIWDNFFPRGISKNKTDFSILRVSCQIHYEIIHYFKWPQCLGHFVIDIDPQEALHHDMIKIWDASLSICWRIPAEVFSHIFGSVVNTIAGFESWPIDKLAIELNIKAPVGPQDPGQAIYLWERCSTLVHWLNLMTNKTVKNLIIRLQDLDNISWVRNWRLDNPAMVYTVRSLSADNITTTHNFGSHRSDDMRLVISPFFDVQRIQNAQIFLGATSMQYTADAECANLLACTLRAATDQILRESLWKRVFHHGGTCLEYLLIQSLLDTGEGPTARHLRLHRFIDWSTNPTAYQNKMLTMVQCCYDLIRSRGLTSTIMTSLRDRFILMRLADPKLRSGQFSSMVNAFEIEYERVFSTEVMVDVVFGEPAAAADWHRMYPDGMPSFANGWWDSRKEWLAYICSNTGYLETLDFWNKTFWSKLTHALAS